MHCVVLMAVPPEQCLLLSCTPPVVNTHAVSAGPKLGCHLRREEGSRD